MEDFSAYAQLKQETQQRSLNLERLLGRQLSATPTHLSRALYLPRHTDSDISHLPLYDISTRYAGTVGDATVGSSIYTVKLGTMPRPKGDGTDDVEVLYLVDFSRTEGDVSAKVQSRGPLSQAPNDDEASLYDSHSMKLWRGMLILATIAIIVERWIQAIPMKQVQ